MKAYRIQCGSRTSNNEWILTELDGKLIKHTGGTIIRYANGHRNIYVEVYAEDIIKGFEKGVKLLNKLVRSDYTKPDFHEEYPDEPVILPKNTRDVVVHKAE